MRYFHICALLFLIVNTFASEVAVITTNEREIILQGTDCKQLQKSEEDILHWTEKVEGHKTASANCICKNAICTINVTNSVPLFVKKWHGIPSKTLSGNCGTVKFYV